MKQKDLQPKKGHPQDRDRRDPRFFIALLPPPTVQHTVNRIKQYFADVYSSRKAFNSPPHITLQPPFEWPKENLPILEQNLKEFAALRSPISMTLSGFAAFPPRVIYINPLKTPELLTLRDDLQQHLQTTLGINSLTEGERKNRPFSPHLTVAFRDLTKANFNRAWPEFKNKAFFAEFVISQLTLLIHNGKQWEIRREFLCTYRDRD